MFYIALVSLAEPGEIATILTTVIAPLDMRVSRTYHTHSLLLLATNLFNIFTHSFMKRMNRTAKILAYVSNRVARVTGATKRKL